MGNLNKISLNYNSVGQISLQLPQGPQTDSYKIYLSVNIIDDTYGLTTYSIINPVIVSPNNALIDGLMQSITNNELNNQMMIDMNSNNLNMVAANTIALSTFFNIQSQNQTSIVTNDNSDNNQKAFMRNYMAQKVASLSVSDVSSIKVIGSALSKLTEIPQQISSNIAVKLVKSKITF